MSRLRYNNALGTLGASLTASGTTITFATAPSFATLASGDYIPLVLDPAASSSPSASFEVVWLTSYTAGANVGTVQRGMEGTTAVSHAVGSVWVMAGTALDIQSMQTPVAARAYRSAALSFSANTWTKIPLDTLSDDSGANMDVVANGRYNCPVAGYYQVTGATEVSGNSTNTAIYKNGTLVVFAGAVNNAVVAADRIKCAAGDYLELWVKSPVTSLYTGDGTAGNYLSVVLLAPVLPASQVTNVARAYRNANQSIIGGSFQKLLFDTKVFDPLGNFDVVSNNRFTAPVSGYYQVSVTVDPTNSSGVGANSQVAIYKNGSLDSKSGNSNNASDIPHLSTVLALNSGDYLEGYYYNGSSFTLVSGSNCHMAVVQIAALTSTGNANALPAGAAYQNGVINSGDLAISSMSINTSTGALTFTLAAAQPCVIKDTTGALIPVTYMGVTAGVFTPPTLPTSGNSRVIGVEMDTNGNISLVSGSSVSGQQSTALTLETNTPATTSGRMRLFDIGVYNNSGSYNFSNASATATQGTNWVDRRPWASGAYVEAHNTAANYSTSTGSYQPIDDSYFRQRLECTGKPVRVCLYGSESASGGSSEGFIAVSVDNDIPAGTTSPTPSRSQFWVAPSAGSGVIYEFVVTGLAAGSHQFRMMWSAASGTPAMGSGAPWGVGWSVEEVMKVNSGNGTS